jgi:hypothetical protein
MVSYKRWIVVGVIVAVAVSLVASGLPYSKLKWIDRARAQGGTYAEETVQSLPDGSLPMRKAVVGAVVKSCQFYWKPDLQYATGVTTALGKTYYVVGINPDATFYMVVPIAYFPQFRLWMPSECLAPNPDAVWQGQDLPANVVTP